MTPDRNPDLRLDSEEIPPGLQLIAGKNMMQIARAKQIPFGVATRINGTSKNQRHETVGLIIRDGDVARFYAALRAKNARIAKPEKTGTTEPGSLTTAR